MPDRTDQPIPFDATEVVPRVWVGAAPPIGKAVSEAGFRLLVLCALPSEYEIIYGSAGTYLARQFDGAYVVFAPLDDQSPNKHEPNLGRPTAEMMIGAKIAAHEIVRWTSRGHKALVTCMQGRNRSAFVAALAVARKTGWSGERAADAVRHARQADVSGPVLYNYWYAGYMQSIPERTLQRGSRAPIPALARRQR
jgi:hypothetical protein